MTVQVQPEPPAGPGVRMVRGVHRGGGPVPQREADPLAAVRPRGRGPHHEVRWGRAGGARGVVAGQCEGEPGTQEPVGGDPRQVPAQQVGGEVAQIVPDAGREVTAVGAGHGAQVEIDVDARGGTRSGPVTGTAARGRGLDHGGRYGVLAYAPPEGEAGIPGRGVSGHQLSPCADGTPNLCREFVVIAGSITPPDARCHRGFPAAYLAGNSRAGRPAQHAGRPARRDQARSNRSRFMTLSQAATKSRTNFSFASSLA